jgi:hypothetical protein
MVNSRMRYPSFDAKRMQNDGVAGRMLIVSGRLEG